MDGMGGGMHPMAGVMMGVWFLIMAGMVVGWVIAVISVWRIMKATETIAERLARPTTPEPPR